MELKSESAISLKFWPSPQDYNEAIQHGSNFKDAELQQAVVEIDKFGLPRVVSGGFACVYQLRTVDRTEAVRCFVHRVADQEKRYQAIAEFLKQSEQSYLLGFQFQPQGIRVAGNWFSSFRQTIRN